MPLLMCPNDNASMQTLTRNGVEFDMCPTCRGVWLDRGELEKLMQSARDALVAEAPAPQRPAPQQSYSERRDYGDEDDDYRGRGRRRRGGFDLFDIFD